MSNEIHRKLPLGVNLHQSLAWLGAIAEQGGNGTAAQICRELLLALDPATEVTVEIPLVDVLCHACDEFRRQGKPLTVEHLERLVQSIKTDPRTIRGQFAFAARTEADLDRAFSTMQAMIKK
jgi:hypothetical protein